MKRWKRKWFDEGYFLFYVVFYFFYGFWYHPSPTITSTLPNLFFVWLCWIQIMYLHHLQNPLLSVHTGLTRCSRYNWRKGAASIKFCPENKKKAAFISCGVRANNIWTSRSILEKTHRGPAVLWSHIRSTNLTFMSLRASAEKSVHG